MDKKEEKINQEGLKPLAQQTKNRNNNVWLVCFFVLLSSLTVFSFRYLSKFSSDRINNFFLSNSVKSENEIIDEKFSDYWERLKKVVELIFAVLVLISAYFSLKSNFQSKILKSADDKDAKKIRDGFLDFQKNIIYDHYAQSGFFDSLKRNTIKEINDCATSIIEKNKKINKLNRQNCSEEFSAGITSNAIPKEKEEISVLEKRITKLSYLLNKIFSKETIFEIIGFFLNSQSVTVNPFCEYNLHIRDNTGESLDEISNYFKEYIFSKANGNGEKVLPIFETNFNQIFFEYYVNEDDNKVLEDVEKVIERAKEVVTHYENLEANGQDVDKIYEISKLAKTKLKTIASYDDESDEFSDEENNNLNDRHLLKSFGVENRTILTEEQQRELELELKGNDESDSD